jgi:carboxyl-terminal processing protease
LNKLVVFFLFPFFVIAQSDKISCETLSKINQLIQEKHYKPKPIDDSLSVYVFEAFLDELDKNSTLFLNSDCNELIKHKFKIDNYVKDKNCDFLESFYTIYNKAVNRHQSIITSVTKESFSYVNDDPIRFYKKKLPFCTTENELKKLYKKRILFDVLTTVSQTSQKKDSILSFFTKIADSTKIKIFDNYICQAQNKLITKEKFTSIFINSFCSYFDPHTIFFSSAEKSDFLSQLSSSNYSFGMNMMMNEKNELSIAEVIPYGPAYYSDKLEVGDVIEKIKINGVEYSSTCNRDEETYKILTSNETKKAIFTLRKNSGEIYSIELQKQLMCDSENNVYSYILDFENKRTGYIKIPSFYSKFENGRTNVSEDVRKEIVKLKDCNIESLIIDLEDNTGGSMDEAENLCGLFIKSPVIAQVKFSNAEQLLVANRSTKPIFNGSIAILINSYSASASEFFTNAMQDYGMAIVIGTKSYGKGSIQNIFEIENEAKDFLKITTGSFYRVTGKSSQYIGITPTIAIPTIFEDYIPREKSAKRALKNEKINGFIANDSYPYNENQNKSIKEYIFQSKTNYTVLKINSLKKRIAKFYENLTPVALNFDSVFDYNKSNYSLWKDVRDYSKIEYDVQIFYPNYILESSKKNESLSKSDKIGVKNIKSNFSIIESIKIIGK